MVKFTRRKDKLGLYLFTTKNDTHDVSVFLLLSTEKHIKYIRQTEIADKFETK